jgi:thiol-disulfide isomerase/thioredoxin
MKKIIFILLLVLSGCVDTDIDTPLIVEDGDVLPPEICENLDQVIVIKKTGCPACAIAIPKLEALEIENNWEFVYYNTAIEKERNELLSLGFAPRYVPTIIVDCKVYAGALEKEKYKELITNWLVA